MNNQDEKIRFSNRLKQALTDAEYPISPTYLSNELNHRYSGSPISVQAANNWLHGKAIPSQDKLSILAIWLNKSAQWLRFGDDSENCSQVTPSSSEELDYFLKFKHLSHQQQKLILNIIDEFLDH